MIISTSLVVPALTTVGGAIREEIKLGKGTLTRVTFDVPPGANGEVYLRVLHLENSIIPDVVNEWIPVSEGKYDFNPLFSEWKDIYKVMLEGCSPGAKFSHSIEVMFELNEVGTFQELLSGFIRIGE